MEFPANRKAPSDYVRLEMFLDMAEHYIRACDDLPLPEGSNKFKVAFEEQPLSTALELRLMLLRKFLEPTGHQNVSLETVTESFRKCYTGPSGALEQNLAMFVDDVQKTMRGEIGFVFDNEPKESHFEYFLAVLYGQLLHADWGKWHALKTSRGFNRNMAVYTIYNTLDHLIREAHFSIAEAMRNGRLQDTPTPRV